MPTVFVAAVVVHAVLLVWLGNPWPGGRYADENVYQELASNLWFDGSYGTRVSVTYPPLYPAVIAPSFAIGSNVARYAAIRLLHALLLGLASLALLPAFRQALGRDRAWLGLAGLQLLGGVVHYGKTTQTEALFTALLVAVLGLAWSAWAKPSGPRWGAVGLLCGLALCTRRTALVLPAAFGLLALVDVVQARCMGRKAEWRSGVAWALGFAVGLLPEAVASSIAGGAIDPYGGPTAGRHLQAGFQAFASPANLSLAAQYSIRHVGWLAWSTAGAPLLLLAALLHRRRPPRAEARAAGLALLIGGGLAAMTVLHMLRFNFKRPTHPGWDLYPRYVDPSEPLLVAAAVLVAAWLVASRERIGARLASGLGLGSAALLLVVGSMDRVRGGRLPKVELLDAVMPAAVSPWAFALTGAAVLLLWSAVASRRALRPAGVLAAALVVSWLVSLHHPVLKLGDPADDPSHRVLRLNALQQEPRAPLGVLVPQPGHDSRKYYEPAFRSDHVVRWLRPEEVVPWARSHPEGFVLIRGKDEAPAGLERLGRAQQWRVYRLPASPVP